MLNRTLDKMINTQIINILNEILDEFYRVQSKVRILDYNSALAFGKNPTGFYLNRVGQNGLIQFKSRIADIVTMYNGENYLIKWYNEKYVGFKQGRFTWSHEVYKY